MGRFVAFAVGWCSCLVSVMASAQAKPLVVFLAGRPSHGYGSHEHLAGCRILADTIQRSTNQEVECRVIGNGWPDDDRVLDDASAIVMYCDGGGGHPAIQHLPRLGELMNRGIGFACLHYAVEVPTHRGGAEFLEWLGGFFETHWSVNPHWVADYTSFPEHAVTRGVRPFKANDEWYFHMRFRPEMDGVTPILSAVAPEHTMTRPDGPHSGNPAVRRAVAEGVPQHTAWVFERSNGGRSFGFTGGHFHWNWGREEILRLVCNAIVWTAKVEVPESGLPVMRPSVERLEQGQDEPIPENHQRDKVKSEFQLHSGASANTSEVSSNESAARNPKNAIAGLKARDGLSVSLSASEPMVRSLTNLDIDHRGRIWVCEVMNYRAHLGKRPEGDRVLILEDSDGDGVMDSSKVFYQGTDIDSAMGICVLGNKVIVSASPHIWLFTDEDGDDIPDRKELLFSKTGQPQHDHSAHSFVFGPDGKLYWNFGNTGKAVHDAEGELVTDRAGNPVVDNGKPYFGGMVFRCNLDGSELETLAHNFRNNYEIAVDAFGTLWQTDNDDDGNKATRVNYVMEFGNYGYRDELTGAGWQSPRNNLEPTIPEQHWHLNDPGVVPTMLLTGAGSPSAVTVYEGSLLPEIFRNQMIHCEPGHNVVRAYPTLRQGAGYKATIENLLVADGDHWFRPVDVCVAPDGSLFVTDWYDPGVGGHAMGDLNRGRLFRLAPPGAKYHVAELDVTTAERAAAALVSPNQSVRYLAWQALQGFGKSAQSALEQLSIDENPRNRARAYWALGKLGANPKNAVALALSDEDSDVRCMGIRLARQLNLAASNYFFKVLEDSASSVRRELAIALRFDSSDDMPGLWASLAASYEGGDRWMLEALGIGAELRWDDCFKAITARLMKHGTQPHQDIVWRARTAEATPFLIEYLTQDELTLEDASRFLRALDYHTPVARSQVVEQSLIRLTQKDKLSSVGQFLVVELLLKHPPAQSAAFSIQLAPIIESELGAASRRKRLEMITNLSVPRAAEQLLDLASSLPVDSVSAMAVERYLAETTPARALVGLHAMEEGRRKAFIQAMAVGKPQQMVAHLLEVLNDATLESDARIAAAKGLARSPAGSRELLKLEKSGKLLPESRVVIGSLLRNSSDESVSEEASRYFPAPKGKAAEELPPLEKLMAMTGDAAKGADVFRTSGTCAKCHPLTSDTRPIGPDLSEVGSKLAKEAIYVAILDPSAGISHNYESYSALTEDGQVITGLMISQTEESIVLRDAEGLDRPLARSELEGFSKLHTSLMPSNLVEQLSTEDLVNLVEYLQTLKKQG